MKYRFNIFLLLVFCAIYTNAQSPTGQKNNKTEEAKVAAVVDQLYTAMVDKNQGVLESLTDAALTYGHSSGTIENKTEYVDAVVNGTFDFISINPAKQIISFSDKKTALVRHFFEAKGLNDGKPTDVRIGVLMVFQNQKGNWKLLARQAYKL